MKAFVSRYSSTFFIVVIGVVITILAVLVEFQLREKALYASAQSALHETASRLEKVFNERLYATHALQAFVTINLGLNLEDPDQLAMFHERFDQFTNSLDMQSEGLISIQLAPDAVVTFVTNRTRNQ